MESRDKEKQEDIRSLRNGLYIVGVLGICVLIALFTVLFRGGWFILLSVLLLFFLVCIVLYSCFILFLIWFIGLPSTTVMDVPVATKENASENQLVPMLKST